ncbi:MAG TPA: hypothetical protein VGF14_06735 [Alphaproteobacteria bacterium]
MSNTIKSPLSDEELIAGYKNTVQYLANATLSNGTPLSEGARDIGLKALQANFIRIHPRLAAAIGGPAQE